MLYDAVMVPFDGSDSACAALDEAVRFAKEDAGLALHVVQIVDLERTAVAKLEARGVDLTESVVPMGMQEAMEEATKEASERLHAQVDGAIRPLMNEKRVCLLPEVHPGRPDREVRAGEWLRAHHHGQPRSGRSARHAG